MTVRQGVFGLFAVAAAIALSGCSAGVDVNTRITVEEAKAGAMANMRKIIDQIPADIVASTDVQPDGPLLRSCGDDESIAWFGTAFVHLTDQSHDFEHVLRAIAEKWNRPYTSTYHLSNGTYPSLFIVGPNNQNYRIGKNADDNAFRIAAYSECFIPAEGVSIFKDY
jgi:hypothetical protein